MDRRDKLPNFAAGRPVCPPRTPGSAADKEQYVAYNVSASIRAALYTGITQADAGLGTHPCLIAAGVAAALLLFPGKSERAMKVCWSPDGRMIYFTSDRDGFHCLWAQRLDATTKRPAGSPLPVYHFHTARRSLLNTGVFRLEISVARDKIVFDMGEITGNVWLAQFNAW